MAEQGIRIQFHKKLTTKECGLDALTVQEAAKEFKKPTPVLRFTGDVHSTEPMTGNLGPYTKFNGRFHAVNLLDGTVHRSPVALLPTEAQEAVEAMVSAGKRDSKDAIVRVAVDITAVYYENRNPTGTKFKYGVQPLIEVSGKDDLASFCESFPLPQKLLPQKNGSSEPARKR